MSRYRITIEYVSRVVLEGEGSLTYAEGRESDLLSGIVQEEDHEVSSFGTDKPVSKLEVCLNEEEDLWAVVSK